MASASGLATVRRGLAGLVRRARGSTVRSSITDLLKQKRPPRRWAGRGRVERGRGNGRWINPGWLKEDSFRSSSSFLSETRSGFRFPAPGARAREARERQRRTLAAGDGQAAGNFSFLSLGFLGVGIAGWHLTLKVGNGVERGPYQGG
jgi:hypothetical protein